MAGFESGQGRSAVDAHLSQWRKDLVDLTRRNRLLYFKHTKVASLEFTQGAAEVQEGLEGGMRGGWRFYLPPEPVEGGHEPESDPPPPRDDQLIVSEHLNRYEPQIKNGLKRLHAIASETFLDKGIWVLYVGLGMLHWVDPDDGKDVRSPLLLVPVDLEEKGRGSGDWRLRLSDDGEPVLNPALTIKLDQLGVSLPTLDEVGRTSYADVRAAVAQAVGRRPWTVADTSILHTFTFHKEVIYRDLLDNAEVIGEHPMVRLLAEGPTSDAAQELDFDPEPEDELDRRHPPEDLASVLDADSSQRQAIIAASQGKSFVLDGPPGTGKSQTIANIITQLLYEGRTVLFVSEKAAALEVVQNRLAAVQLDAFVLALHSHTATRKAVAQELGQALAERPTAQVRFSSKDQARVARDREELNAYAIAINEVRQPLGMTIHDAIGRISTLDASLPPAPVPRIDATTLSGVDLDHLLDVAGQLGRNWGPVIRGDDFLWRDLREASPLPTYQAELRQTVDQTREQLALLRDRCALIQSDLRLSHEPTPGAVDGLLHLLALVDDREGIGVAWLVAEELDSVSATVEEIAAAIDARSGAADQLDALCTDWQALDPTASAAVDAHLQALASADPPFPVEEASPAAALAQQADVLERAAALLEDLSGPATELAGRFGLDEPNLDVLERLIELGQLAQSPVRPEPQWLNPAVTQAIEEARRVLGTLVDTFRERRESLAATFRPEILDADVTTLRARFQDVHKGLKKLSGAYRADKRTLAALTVAGKVTPEALARLDDVIEWQRIANDLATAERQHQQRLGSFYEDRDSVDFTLIEQAMEIAVRALEVAGNDIQPEVLTSALGNQADPDAALVTLTRAVRSTLESLQATGLDDVVGEAASALRGQPISRGAMWCRQVVSELRESHEHLAPVATTLRSGDSIVGCVRALQWRAHHAHQQELVEQHRLAVEVELGSLVSCESSEVLRRACAWVASVREALGTDLTATTAEMLLTTDLTESDLREQAERYEKSRSELLGHFNPDYAEELAADLDASFDAASELLEQLHGTVGEVQEWAGHIDARQALQGAGLDAVIDAAEGARVDATQVRDMFERALLQRWVDQQVAQDPRLRRRRAADRDALVQEFRALDAELTRHAAAKVINECSGRRPSSLAGQARIIQQQAQLKRRHWPVRRLLAEAGEAAQRVKPCFMMSPLSVSHFLPPGLHFDVVIFDEASQVREADAIGCIYRGRQLIVAGDQKQLPPTSFFEQTTDGEGDGSGDDEDLVHDFESVLDRCKGQGLRALPLMWHYRSQHESLISYSNYSFYEGRLHTFPGATFDAPDLGVELFHVDGEFRRGGTRDNPVEAATVVDRVLHHRRHHPALTIGVVALSAAQQTAVEAELERRSSSEPELRELITDDRLDGFFVKNLENVQGDERDIIILTIGYGPDEAGKLTMHFGPLNKAGGERRLNVAVTRARRRVEVVSSITAGDITSENSSVLHLKRYLDFAERGAAALALDLEGSVGDAESPFEEEVIRVVRELGYDPVPQVGVAQYRIDIGVRHPGKPGEFMLGIECDGATYHSSKVARDRDRLRQEVLEGLGWKIHRIWSTAWYSEREQQIERLRHALAQAVDGSPSSPALKRATPELEVDVVEIDPAELPDWAVPYEEPVLRPTRIRAEFTDDAARSEIVAQITDVVAATGAIYEDVLLRIVRDAWGIQRAGARIKQAFAAALRLAVRREAWLEHDGGFVTDRRWEPSVRVPMDEYEAPRPVREVPPAELDLAIVRILGDAGTTAANDLRTAWARLFGWRRAGAEIDAAFERSLDRLRRKGRISGDETIRLTES